MGKTKEQKQNQNKEKKIAKLNKYSLLSPYFTYFETMPSNNTKIFVNKTLPDMLENIADQGEYEPK